ncbi:hypothetical protein KNE206_44400 [Kitasatospora sp. NE20-6]
MKRQQRKAPQASRGYRIDAHDAPAEGSDAGPSDDLDHSYLARQIGKHRSNALRAFGDAQRLLSHDRKRAETRVVEALDSAARAFWWAEESPFEERQHELLHKIGRWRRRNEMGCSLDYDGKSYSQRCPAAIAHKKIGFSIGFTAERLCSICGFDLSECPHLRDRSYWVRGGCAIREYCRVCAQQNCQSHHPDRLYRARPISIIVEGEIREVSIVAKPAQPEARLSAVPIDMNGLADQLGPGFIPGVQVSCDQCLGGCVGFSGIDA